MNSVIEGQLTFNGIGWGWVGDGDKGVSKCMIKISYPGNSTRRYILGWTRKGDFWDFEKWSLFVS